MTRKAVSALALAAAATLAFTLAACAPSGQPGALISVTAQAEAKTTPDLATINVGVESRGATAKAAQDAQASKMTAIIATLEAQGVDEDDIQTSQIGLNPITEWNERGQSRITGYQSVNTVAVKVRDLSKVSTIIDAIVADGSNRIDGIAFSMDDAEKAEAEAHAEAVRKARARAEGYAQGAGLKVHRLVSIVEQGGSAMPPMPMDAMVTRALPTESATPIMPGQVSTGAAVTVVFELR
ncbi:MAG: SIMPL domain-containing protein [Hyphomonadaceae bacterium]|jgi:hypothetical protein|nr:SIMPL domain-containing protein [Hyphomonadaceae bacterium]